MNGEPAAIEQKIGFVHVSDFLGIVKYPHGSFLEPQPYELVKAKKQKFKQTVIKSLKNSFWVPDKQVLNVKQIMKKIFVAPVVFGK